MHATPEPGAMTEQTPQNVLRLQTALETTANAAAAAAKAQTALARATQSAAKAAKNAIAGFDELHVAAKGSASGSKKSTAATKEKPAEAQSALELWKENTLAALDKARQRLQMLLAPSITAWLGAAQQVGTALTAALAAVSGAAKSLWDTALAPLLRQLTGKFLPGVANALSLAFAPITGDVLRTALALFSESFSRVCTLAASALQTLVGPALTLIQDIFTQMMETIALTWLTYGAPVLEGVQRGCTALGEIFSALYYTIVQPVLESIMTQLRRLWSETLAPLWQNICALAANAALLVAQIWNETLAPFVRFFVDTFGPVIAQVLQGAGEGFGNLLQAAGSVANSIINVLRGLIEFISGAFSGDWGRAWEGIKQAFGGAWDGIVALLKGAVNLIIDCINVMLRGLASDVNAVVGALNGLHVTVPRWVPVYGGKSFGFSLPTLTPAQIPRLAKGAVIPPNAEFLAVLGDQKSGRNLETPEALLRQIVREETGGAPLRLEAQQPVELSLDGSVFYRAMLDIKAARGVELGGAFFNAI